MRSPQKSNRPRGRARKGGGGGNGGNIVNRVYESAGPEGKVRGTPQQIIEKYLSLARDSQTSSDRVNYENFLQHAEHYQRLLAAAAGAQQERREQQDSSEDEDERPEAEERQAQPAREQSQSDGGGRRRGGDQGVSGMQTIEAEGESGPELIVTPEEVGATRSRRRRGGGQAQPDSEDAPRAAGGAAD